MKTDSTFENLVNLLAVYSEAKSRLAQLEADNNQAFLAIVDERKKEYAELQTSLTAAEAAIKLIAADHPEWFPAEQRTVKTPYGAVHAQRSTKHEAADEVLTIDLIERGIARAEQIGNTAVAAELRALIKIEKSLDLEAAAKLDTDRLAAFRILRIESDSITIKEAKVSLGNAVKAAEKKAAKAAVKKGDA